MRTSHQSKGENVFAERREFPLRFHSITHFPHSERAIHEHGDGEGLDQFAWQSTLRHLNLYVVGILVIHVCAWMWCSLICVCDVSNVKPFPRGSLEQLRGKTVFIPYYSLAMANDLRHMSNVSSVSISTLNRSIFCPKKRFLSFPLHLLVILAQRVGINYLSSLLSADFFRTCLSHWVIVADENLLQRRLFQ